MPLARSVLKADLTENCPNIEIVGEAEGVVSGAKVLKEIEADILFLDIQLLDGTGFDLLEIIQQPNCKVIFTTASDEHAIKAFQFSAFDYLLKPIDTELLKKAVSKIESEIEGGKQQLNLLKEQFKSGKTEKIALHTLEKIIVANIRDVIRCEANGNYTQFFLTSGKKILVTKTLKEFELMLSDHAFVRVHQSHLVSIDHIKEYVKQEGGYLIMSDETMVSVSVRKKPYVVKLLSDL